MTSSRAMYDWENHSLVSLRVMGSSVMAHEQIDVLVSFCYIFYINPGDIQYVESGKANAS